VRDAREHGVAVLPPDVNRVGHDCTLEPDPAGPPVRDRLHQRHREMAGDIASRHAIRLGLRQVKGVGEKEAEAILSARGNGYSSVRDLWMRAGVTRGVLEALADADAFRSMGLGRREALWQVRALDGRDARQAMPLFEGVGTDDPVPEQPVRLPQMPAGEEVIQDYRTMALSLRNHPVAFLREDLKDRGLVECRAIETLAARRRAAVAGLIVVRQRPGSARGVVFMTVEDETSIVNAIVWPKVMEKYRAVVLGSRLVILHGEVQRADGVTHLVVNHLENATAMLAGLLEEAGDDPELGALAGLANADEIRRPVMETRARGKLRQEVSRLLSDAPELRQDYERLARSAGKVMPKGRNFQ